MELKELKELGFKIEERNTNILQYGNINLEDIMNAQDIDELDNVECEELETIYDFTETDYILLDNIDNIVLEAETLSELVELIKDYFIK